MSLTVAMMKQLLMLVTTMMMTTMMTMSASEERLPQTRCGAVTPKGSGTTYVTCHFLRDISNFDFNIQFYPNDEGLAETALACNRMSSGGLNCHKDRGVHFDEFHEVKSTLTFSRKATHNGPGSQYQCQVVSSLPGESAQRCTVSEIALPENKSEQHELSVDLNWILHGVTMFLVVVGFVLTICCLIVRKGRQRTSGYDHDVEESQHCLSQEPQADISGSAVSPAPSQSVPQQSADPQRSNNPLTTFKQFFKPSSWIEKAAGAASTTKSAGEEDDFEHIDLVPKGQEVHASSRTGMAPALETDGRDSHGKKVDPQSPEDRLKKTGKKTKDGKKEEKRKSLPALNGNALENDKTNMSLSFHH